MTELQLQAMFALAIPRIIEWLKGQKWFPFANFSGGSINRVFSWTVAALTGLGIAFKYDPSVGSVLITGLTIQGITNGLGHIVFQILANHFIYKATVAPALPGLQQAINRDTGTTNAVPVTAVVPVAPAVPATQPSPIGPAVPGSKHCFTAAPGDTTLVGESHTVGGNTFLKITPTEYEMQ